MVLFFQSLTYNIQGDLHTNNYARVHSGTPQSARIRPTSAHVAHTNGHLQASPFGQLASSDPPEGKVRQRNVSSLPRRGGMGPRSGKKNRLWRNAQQARAFRSDVADPLDRSPHRRHARGQPSPTTFEGIHSRGAERETRQAENQGHYAGAHHPVRERSRSRGRRPSDDWNGHRVSKARSFPCRGRARHPYPCRTNQSCTHRAKAPWPYWKGARARS